MRKVKLMKTSVGQNSGFVEKGFEKHGFSEKGNSPGVGRMSFRNLRGRGGDPLI